MQAPKPTPPRNGTNGANGGHAGVKENGSGYSNGQAGRAASPASAGPRHLTLRLNETGVPENDRNLLDDIKAILLEYRGEDDVWLEIAADGRIITMDWPMLKVAINPSLERELEKMLGEGGVRVG